MDNQCYFNGDFWQCVAATNAGETPDSAPTKWRRTKILKPWRRVLSQLTYAGLLELDGQTDKAKLHRDAGESQLDDMVRKAANQELNRRSGITGGSQGHAVKASVILDDAYRMMRWELSDIEDSQKADGRMALSRALQQVWEAWWWEPLMLLAEETLRPAYVDGTFYARATEIYFPPNGKYYLAIQPSVSIPPASLVSGIYVLNNGFWAESAEHFCGGDVDNTLAYDWGAVVRNPADGLFYQRGGSLSVSGTNSDFANGIYQVHPSANFSGRVVYWPGDAPSGDYNQATRFSANVPWVFLVVDNTPAAIAYYFGQTVPVPLTPDLETNWTVNNPIFPGSLPGPTFTRSFVAPAPPDIGSWGLLTRFDPVLTIATQVRAVTRHHPRHEAPTFPLEETDGGVRVCGWKNGTAWVWSRRVTPVVTGDDFDSATTYEATPTEEIVYDS